MDADSPLAASPEAPAASLFRWTLGFLLVGAAWGLTTPFMRRAALQKSSSSSAGSSDTLETPQHQQSLVQKFLTTLRDLLSNPKYTIPLLVNITGSVWFFLLIGQADLSLTVPVTNSLAFLFTVLGDWWVDGTVVEKQTWVGMALVLAGIASCVWAKT